MKQAFTNTPVCRMIGNITVPLLIVLFYLCAFATPFWVTVGERSQHWGLWTSCYNDTSSSADDSETCYYIGVGESDAYLEAVRVLASLPLLCYLVLIFQISLMELVCCKGQLGPMVAYLGAFVNMVMLVVVAALYRDDPRWRDKSPSLSWSYWCAVPSTLLALLDGLAMSYAAHKRRFPHGKRTPKRSKTKGKTSPSSAVPTPRNVAGWKGGSSERRKKDAEDPDLDERGCEDELNIWTTRVPVLPTGGGKTTSVKASTLKETPQPEAVNQASPSRQVRASPAGKGRSGGAKTKDARQAGAGKEQKKLSKREGRAADSRGTDCDMQGCGVENVSNPATGERGDSPYSAMDISDGHMASYRPPRGRKGMWVVPQHHDDGAVEEEEEAGGGNDVVQYREDAVVGRHDVTPSHVAILPSQGGGGVDSGERENRKRSARAGTARARGWEVTEPADKGTTPRPDGLSTWRFSVISPQPNRLVNGGVQVQTVDDYEEWSNERGCDMADLGSSERL